MPLIVSGRLKLVTCGAFGTRSGRVSGGQPAEAEEKAPPRGRGDRAAAGDGGTATAPPPEPPKPVEKTWFRAKLVDEEGQPMAGEDYVLVTSDGANRKGKLDANGEVYIPPILPPGDCTISFPNIHLNPLKRKK